MNQFLNRYRNKSKNELEQIIANPEVYTKEAIEAAEFYLKLNEFESKPEASDRYKAKKQSRDRVGSPAQLKTFLYSLTLKEFLTYNTLTIFYWSFFELVILYSDEINNERLINHLLFSVFALLFVINHLIYKVERKKALTYFERVMNSLLFFSVFIIFRMCYQAVIDGENLYEFNFFAIVLGLILIVIAVMILEQIITAVNWLLNKVGWPEL